MFQLNKKIEYALIVIKHISEKKTKKTLGRQNQSTKPASLTSAREICDAYNTPFDVTSRVMQIMVQKGVLCSEQGAQGGYRLARDLKTLSFLELAEMILGPVNVVKCLCKDTVSCKCSTKCNILSPVARLNREIKRFYDSLSVMELVENKGKMERENELTSLP